MRIRNLLVVMSMVLMSTIVFVGCKNKECKEKSCDGTGSKDVCCHKDSTKADAVDTTKQDLGASSSVKTASEDPFSTANYFCPMKCEGGYSDAPGKCPTCGMDLKQRQG